MVDFKLLLKKKADDCRPEPPLPDGTYRGRIEKYELGVTKNDTPYVKYFYRFIAAEDDVDESALVDDRGEQIDLTKVIKTSSFWLTHKADHMLVKFAATCGVKTTGRELSEIIPEVINAEILIPVSQKIDEKDPTKVYNIIGDITGA